MNIVDMILTLKKEDEEINIEQKELKNKFNKLIKDLKNENFQNDISKEFQKNEINELKNDIKENNLTNENLEQHQKKYIQIKNLDNKRAKNEDKIILSDYSINSNDNEN